MQHLKYCELDHITSFLISVDNTLHETVHAYESQIPLMKANQGNTFNKLSNMEVFNLDPVSSVCIEFPKSKLYPSIKLV
jgi:hypothetical protein